MTREGPPFFTQNDHYLDSSRGKWLAYYNLTYENQDRYHQDRRERSFSPASEFVDERPAIFMSERAVRADPPGVRALKALAELGYSDLTQADFVRLHPPNQFQEELEMMADVRAYFQVSYKVNCSLRRLVHELTMSSFNGDIVHVENNRQRPNHDLPLSERRRCAQHAGLPVCRAGKSRGI